MATISIVQDWGAITDLTKGVKVGSGLVMSTTGAPAANQFLVDKPRRGTLWRMLTVLLPAPRSGFILQNKSKIGPNVSIYPVGLITTEGGEWRIFHRWSSGYSEGLTKAGLTFSNAVECWASRIYSGIAGASFLLTFNYKCGAWLFESFFPTAWELGGMTRIGRNLLISQLNGPSIQVCRAKGSTVIFGQILTAPFNIRRMAFDGRYLWLTSSTNLYQCILR